MDEFATQGTVQVGDSMAALAMVRALVRTLEKRNVLSWDDMSSIVKDALAQIEKHSTTVGGQEAKRLIQEFRSQFVVRK
jgi:hypothetical protein